MYVMWIYAYVSTPLFSEVWPPPSLLGDMALTRHFLRWLKRPTLGWCSEYHQGRRAVSTPAHALLNLVTTFHIGALRNIPCSGSLRTTFQGSVGFTADFPVQWPESEIPRLEPRFKGFGFEGVICPCCLPLELLARWNHYFFQFQSALCFPFVEFLIIFFFQYFELEVLVRVPVPGVNSLHQVEEDQLALSQTRQYMSNNRLFTPC